MKKQELPRLTLHRETLRRLDEPALRGLAGGADPASTQCTVCPDCTAPHTTTGG
jgi:hypothetical protein